MFIKLGIMLSLYYFSILKIALERINEPNNARFMNEQQFQVTLLHQKCEKSTLI